MRKRDELASPNSCLNKAKDDEMLFVLIGRDVAAPAAIRAWVSERIRLGKNSEHDAQIREALDCANAMESPMRLDRTTAKQLEDNCPGRFKCHGPASWCDQCGDVDLTCDDPHCDVHQRFMERQTKRDVAYDRLVKAKELLREAQKEYDEAASALARWVDGNPVMVARKPKPGGRGLDRVE